MSFVFAAPEQVQTTAQALGGIRSTLTEASASVAAPTSAMAAAAADQVSAGVAALFNSFGQEYQVFSAEAQAFHAQFVNVLNTGAAAYVSTEFANAEQTAQGLLGPGSGTAANARSLLGGGGTSGIAGLPAALSGFGHGLAPGLAQTGASTSVATSGGPYQTLWTNTVANLQTLGGAISANPAPFLQQFLTNQAGYANIVAGDIRYVIQNFPALLANLPANIEALLAFDPRPVVQQIINNQITTAQFIITSLTNAAHDFGTGLQALPMAFQSAFQALQMGDVGGAVGDLANGFVNLFVTGVDVTTTGGIMIPGTSSIIATVTPTGTVGDLLPLLTVPGMVAQNFTSLLPPGSIAAQISQNATNVINTVTDVSITADVSADIRLLRIPPVILSLDGNFGLPLTLTIEALGAPINAGGAFGSSAAAVVQDLETGNPIGAIGTLVDAPAVITDAFLNGQTTLPITFDISGLPTTVNIPLDGLLVPQTPYTASVDFGPPIGSLTVPVGGTPISGLATGLLVYAPEQLALAITPDM